MAARNIQVTLGLFSVPMGMESAISRPPTMSNFCVGQPGHDAHEPVALTAPSRCGSCGEITDKTVLRKGIKSGRQVTMVDPGEITQAREEFAKKYEGEIKLVPHPASDFLTATTAGDTLSFLTPTDAAQADRYQLMVRAVESHPELVFAGLYTPASAAPKTHLFMLQVRHGVLLLQKRVREQAIKPIPSVGGAVDEKHVAVLDSWIEMFTEPYDSIAYEDKYALAIDQMIADGEVHAMERSLTPMSADDAEVMAKIAELVKAKKEAA